MTTNKPEVFIFDSHGHNAPAYSCNRPLDNSGEYVRLSDYDALQADRDQQYSMKVKARKQRDEVTTKLRALYTENEALRAMILRDLDRDAAYGKAARGEMAAELRSAISEQQSAECTLNADCEQVTEVEAPSHSLPNWNECNLRVGNSKWLKDTDRKAEHDSLTANPLHEFIYEYDDSDAYKSAWFLHRLEKLIDFVRSEQQPAPIFGDEDHVSIPRRMIAAACSAIDKKRDAAKVLAELRRYTVGDLSRQAAPDVSALVDALEEIIHPVRFMQERLEEGERLNGMVAVQLAEDASYLRGIAKAALAAYRKQGGES